MMKIQAISFTLLASPVVAEIGTCEFPNTTLSDEIIGADASDPEIEAVVNGEPVYAFPVVINENVTGFAARKGQPVEIISVYFDARRSATLARHFDQRRGGTCEFAQ